MWPALTGKGWRTAGQGNGAKGWLDAVLLHPRLGVLHVVEFKDATGYVSQEQGMWLSAWEALGAVTSDRVQVHVWRPEDWLDGSVERVLRGGAA